MQIEKLIELLRTGPDEQRIVAIESVLELGNQVILREDRELDMALLSFFSRAFSRDGIRDLTFFEAADYFRLFFVQAVMKGITERIGRLVAFLENLLKSADPSIKEVILLGVLEHVFMNNMNRALFAKWKTSELRSIFEEAVTLSEGFKRIT